HFRRRIDPLRESVTRWRVLPSDLDLFGHMTNGRYLSMMDLARIDFLVRLGMLGTVLKRRWIAPVGCAYVDFRGTLRPFERYEIRTRLVYWDHKWFYFRQDFCRVDEPGRVVGTGYVKAVFRGPSGSVTPDQVIRAAAP